MVEEFDKRFPAGVPSLKEAESLVVDGDWTFGEGVKVQGSAKLKGDHGRVEAGTVLGEDGCFGIGSRHACRLGPAAAARSRTTSSGCSRASSRCSPSSTR